MYNGSVAAVQEFASAIGATFPMLLNAGYLQAPCATTPCQTTYGIPYDNYVVVDADGVVRYTSVNERFTGVGRFNSVHIRAAILAYLPDAVEGRTWSGVKQLFR